jgi:hypothetical protein
VLLSESGLRARAILTRNAVGWHSLMTRQGKAREGSQVLIALAATQTLARFLALGGL